MAYSLRPLVFALSLLLMSLGSSARAQTPPMEQSVRFTVFCPRAATGIAFVPKADASPLSLVFYPTARSPRYEYRGTMPLRLIDPRTLDVVAEATIPPAMTEVLLILVPVEPAANEGKSYRVFVWDDGAVAHAPGSLAIVNFTGLELSGTWEGKPITLVAGLNLVRTLARSARLNLRTFFKNRSYQAYVGEVALGNGERALLLLLPPFDSGSLEVQSRLLTDSPPLMVP